MKNYKFTIRGKQYEVDIKSIENNLADIEVNGTSYKVEIHKEIKTTKTPTLVRSDINIVKKKETTKPATIKLFQVKAPLPGNIIEIKVKEGDNIKKGNILLTMEAMKMENNVLAEKEGIVRSIKVNIGQSILQNDVLIEIE